MRRFGTSEYDKYKYAHGWATSFITWFVQVLLYENQLLFCKGLRAKPGKVTEHHFFCRTVITISILMKIWKRSDIKFRSLQPQFHFKFSLAIQNLGMSSIIKVWQILLLGCKEMTLWISYSKLFIFKGWGEKNGVMGDRTVGYIQPAGQK